MNFSEDIQNKIKALPKYVREGAVSSYKNLRPLVLETIQTLENIKPREIERR